MKALTSNPRTTIAGLIAALTYVGNNIRGGMSTAEIVQVALTAIAMAAVGIFAHDAKPAV